MSDHSESTLTQDDQVPDQPSSHWHAMYKLATSLDYNQEEQDRLYALWQETLAKEKANKPTLLLKPKLDSKPTHPTHPEKPNKIQQVSPSRPQRVEKLIKDNDSSGDSSKESSPHKNKNRSKNKNKSKNKNMSRVGRFNFRKKSSKKPTTKTN